MIPRTPLLTTRYLAIRQLNRRHEAVTTASCRYLQTTVSTPFPDPAGKKPQTDYTKEKPVPPDLVQRYKGPPGLPRLERDGEESRTSKLRKNLFFRLLEYLTDYEKLIDVPKKLVAASKVMINGTKLLVKDMRDFAWVYKVLSTSGNWKQASSTLTRRQLELYMNLPSEMYRVAPVLLVSAFPLMQNVAFPVALMYPKQLLSSHYWTEEVKAEVALSEVKVRHKYYRHLLRDLQKALENIKGTPLHEITLNALRKLTVGGGHPSTEEIVALKPVFTIGGAFSLAKINTLHLRHLMKVNGRSFWFLWRHNLREHANLMREMDKAVMRENLDTMSDADMATCCRIRGLNLQGLQRQDLLDYMTKWLEVSSRLDDRPSSLLLHLPVLLGYNHETRQWDTASLR